ncbi:MAG: hypothetical protein HXS54_12320 [Theionarchaea archaeon]|nr:hypothetical protein [Theionarchaea archaeon]
MVSHVYNGVLIVVILGAFLLGCKIIYKTMRQTKLEKISHKMGFTYTPEATVNLPDLRLFTTVRTGHTRNLLTGKRHFITWSIFDYFIAGKGGSQTVVMAQLDTKLPEFSLSPEYFYDNTGEYTGFQDIRFVEYPEFSQKYHLKGKNVKSVKRLFSPHVIERLLRENLDSKVEAKGYYIIICSLIRCVNPKDLPTFFQKATTIVDLFMES